MGTGEQQVVSTGGTGQGRRVVFVSAGASHTVALLSGEVVCSFGRGEDGQLGHGNAEDQHLPKIIGALSDSDISLVACGADHTTAYSARKLTIYSWGWGDFGRLGHGNSSDLFIPQPIKALQGLEIKQIACGDSHCLAITGDGDVYSWGRNQNGQLGLGDTEDSLVPQKLLAFEGLAVRMVAAGAEHTAAVTESGKLYGWGWGRYGNLGLGDRSDRLLPCQVPDVVPNEKMCMVACGWRHTIAVSHSGKLYTYGWSKYGQLGHGDYADHLLPHQIASLQEFRITQVSGGWRHTVALTESGNIYGWGWNKFGQVGSGDVEDHPSPQLISIPGQQRIVQVSCGWRHTIAVTDKDNVYSWGRGTSGQLGHGDAVDRNTPKGIQAVSADGYACVGLESSPELSCTGSGSVNWVSPSERYAVVPDEGIVGQSEDASVPDTDVKRIRTF